MRLMVALLALSLAQAQIPKRIASAAPSITEMLYALGLGGRVVGVTEYCHYPPEALKLPKVASYIKPNMEALLAVRPDLVIIPKTALHSRAPYDQMHLPVLEVQYESVVDIYSAIDAIGNRAGVPERARTLNERIHAELDATRRIAAAAKPESVLFIVGRTPGALDGLVAVGHANYINEVMTLAGGRNIFSDAPGGYPKVGLEDIIARNPEVILDMGEMAQTTGVTDAHKQAVVRLWSRYPILKAVKSRRVHPIASDIYVVPGPRVVELAREFVRLFHPELATNR